MEHYMENEKTVGELIREDLAEIKMQLGCLNELLSAHTDREIRDALSNNPNKEEVIEA